MWTGRGFVDWGERFSIVKVLLPVPEDECIDVEEADDVREPIPGNELVDGAKHQVQYDAED